MAEMCNNSAEYGLKSGISDTVMTVMIMMIMMVMTIMRKETI